MTVAHDIEWPALQERVVERFTRGWAHPAPDAWDEMVAADVELIQPLLGSGRGVALWHRESARLLRFAPDTVGEVRGWSGEGNVVFIELLITATVGGAPFAFTTVDRITIGEDGLVTQRIAYFNPLPIVATVLRRPRAWLAFVRFGIGRRS